MLSPIATATHSNGTTSYAMLAANDRCSITLAKYSMCTNASSTSSSAIAAITGCRFSQSGFFFPAGVAGTRLLRFLDVLPRLLLGLLHLGFGVNLRLQLVDSLAQLA
jgi:hypothetical protein